MHKAIFGWGAEKKKRLLQGNDEDPIMASYTYLNMCYSILKKVGITKDDTIIVAQDARNSWRKAFLEEYKGQRQALRDSNAHIDWNLQYTLINKLERQLNETTDWHFIKLENIFNYADLVLTDEGQRLKIEDFGSVPYDKEFGCIDGKTLIKTNNGEKMIKDLNGNEKIYSYNFVTKKIELSNIVNIQKTKSNHRYNLYFEGETDILKITEEHPVYTTKGWKEVKKLKVGDIIYHTSDCKLENSKYQKQLGYFIGYLLGDGHINYSNHKIRIETIDYDSIINLKKLCNILFDYNPNICTHKRDNPNWSTTYSINITKRNVFYNIIADLDLKTEKEFQKGFIGGFFDAEGTFNKQRNIMRITNTNKNLINYVLTIFNRFKLRTKSYLFNDIKSKNLPIFALDINGKKRTDKFFSLFDTAIERKRPLNLQNGYKIRKIKYLKSRRSWINYNLEISPNNNYFANNLLVHNCESDDIQSVCPKFFPDKEVILVTIDEDLLQVCHYKNCKIFNPYQKSPTNKADKGFYKIIDNPLKIITKKVRSGDKADNILINKKLDTDRDVDIRRFIIDLIHLPNFVEKPIISALKQLDYTKEVLHDQLPFQNSLAKRFDTIYDQSGIRTWEESVKKHNIREEKKKLKAKENYAKKKAKEKKKVKV